ncbi:hypothetical protein E2C01_048477 [Portunus trituberculatus]|uniref:Uncharacterized protein n=1 Tax=Portunus trituberculatus TaxID=210409 RepID=A0A5B7GAN5_PORTR|nr:hypothetical protein [Portunus trituberculatus]
MSVMTSIFYSFPNIEIFCYCCVETSHCEGVVCTCCWRLVLFSVGATGKAAAKVTLLGNNLRAAGVNLCKCREPRTAARQITFPRLEVEAPGAEARQKVECVLVEIMELEDMMVVVVEVAMWRMQ